MKLDSVHCSNYDRSWVDLVTNLSLLTGVDLNHQFGNFLQYGKFPQSCLAAFLHELTHHWCFQSPVGSALATLYLRARRRALIIDAKGEDWESTSNFDVVEDLSRFELVLNLLRPLAEGLALFAEFDVVPRRSSRFMTIPLQWVYLSFTTPSKEELKNEFGFSLFSLIHAMRTSAVYRKRKASSLLEPLDCGHGGYLAGYLTVKRLWLDAVRRSELFDDTELFLAFLRSFIYDDFGLVAHMLDPSLSEINAFNAISTHIQNRFNEFLDLDIGREGERFSKILFSLKVGTREHTIRLGTDETLAQVGKHRMEELSAEMMSQSASEIEEQIKHMDRWTLAQRDIMCIGSTTARLQVTAPGRILVQTPEGPILAGPHLPGAAVVDGPCCVELYISPNGFFKAGVVSQNQMIISSHLISLTKLDEHLQWQFNSYLVDRDRNKALSENFAARMEELIKDKLSFVLLQHVREYVAEAPNAIYSNLLSSMFDGLSETFINSMMTDGFSKLFDNDAKAVQAIACFSLCCSLTGQKNVIADLMKACGYELDTALNIAERVRKHTGIRLAVVEGNHVMSLI